MYVTVRIARVERENELSCERKRKRVTSIDTKEGKKE